MKHLLPLLAFGILPVSAQNISTDAAHQLARQFFTSHAAVGAHHAPAKVEPVLTYTATTASTPDFYVFNRAEDIPGFVIVNADATSETQILGYCESSTFDYETAPDNFKWWLELYQTNGVAKVPAKAAGIRHDVDYLCKTKWNQDSPYWNAIPGGYNFVTGCAATSMAQVMKCYEYPDRGFGSHAYYIDYNGGDIRVNFSADFGNTTYDWANMLDDYSQGYHSNEANAVATLMYHCGVAQNMNYGQAASGGSGAGTGKNGQAMIEHFKYDKSMQYADRLYYGDDEWADMLYNEIVNSRPILYSGQAKKTVSGRDVYEGHSFVCDGYKDDDQTFHFNWGWGGYCDGYFALVGQDALNPNGSGIGGSTSGNGYVYEQVALVNIKPDEGGDYVKVLGARDNLCFYNPNGYLVKNYDLDLRNGTKTFYYSYTIQNASLYDFSGFTVGIELRHSLTGECHYSSGVSYQYELPIGNYFTRRWEMSFSSDEFDLCNGVYELRPAFKIDGEWHTGLYGHEFAIPTLTVTGGQDAQPIELPFTLSAREIEVGKTATITPSPYFNGTVSYSSSDPTIAQVSDEGIITGLKEGRVRITATSTATSAFLATTKYFDMDVVSHIMHHVQISLDKQHLMVGETANISLSKAYEGEVTYTVVPEGIVSVSADGLVTAIAEGEATITVNVAGNYDFRPARKQFEVSVSRVPATPVVPGFCMNNYPYVGQDNIATGKDMTLHIPLYNNSGSSVNPAIFYVRMYCDGGYVTWTCRFNEPYPPAYQYEYTIDPIQHNCKQYFTPGNVYTYEFYLDENCTNPMNVPSLVYYYCPDNPTITTAAHLIDGAKAGNGATPRLIKSLTAKILK